MDNIPIIICEHCKEPADTKIWDHVFNRWIYIHDSTKDSSSLCYRGVRQDIIREKL